jgi:hypothetical protein
MSSAARREGNHMNKQFDFCERCGAKLAGDKNWWLELDHRTGTYTDQEVPAEFSQGSFAFGKDCAKIMLAEHKAAEHSVHMDSAPPYTSEELDIITNPRRNGALRNPPSTPEGV